VPVGNNLETEIIIKERVKKIYLYLKIDTEEVYKNFKKPIVSQAMRSFINTYKPDIV